MILKKALTADIYNHRPFARCVACGSSSFIPAIASIGQVNLFVNFGTIMPSSYTISLVNACNKESTPVTSSCFVVGFNGSYFYGVFKKLSVDITYPTFLFALQVGVDTYFTDPAMIGDCNGLMELSVCYPTNYNAEDINGAYIGAPDPSFAIQGSDVVRYKNIAWIRGGEIIESANKLDIVSSKLKSFSSVLTKNWSLRSELVPTWYKDILLAIFFRGNILINGTVAKISALDFTDTDVEKWQAAVILEKQFKGTFGCSPVDCEDECDICCNPSQVSARVTSSNGTPPPVITQDTQISGQNSPTINSNCITRYVLVVTAAIGDSLTISATIVHGSYEEYEPSTPETVTYSAPLTYTQDLANAAGQGFSRISFTVVNNTTNTTKSVMLTRNNNNTAC